jgi:hypothetical protein
MESTWESHRNPGLRQSLFKRARARNAEVKYACSQCGIGFACRKHIGEVRDGPSATGSDDGNADRLTDGRSEFAIESCARAIGVHRSQKNLASTASFGFTRPLDDAPARGPAAALHEDLCVAHRIGGLRIAPSIDGDDDGLRAEAAADCINESGIGKSGRVYADFVRAGIEDLFRITGTANAAAHGEGHKERSGGASNRVQKRGAAFVRCGDVEKHNFVCALAGVPRGKLCRIAGVDDVNELDTFDDAAGVDIQTGYDALG